MAYIDRFNPPNMHHIGGINYVMMTDCANMVKEIERLREDNERLREALSVIWGWYPTNVSNPHIQIKQMREFAHLASNDGDFHQYLKDHYAALKEGE